LTSRKIWREEIRNLGNYFPEKGAALHLAVKAAKEPHWDDVN